MLPLYDPGAPASKEVEHATEAIAWADAFILASPDYHGSVSGAPKNFLDHFYEEFAGKVFGYIVASHEKRPYRYGTNAHMQYASAMVGVCPMGYR